MGKKWHLLILGLVGLLAVESKFYYIEYFLSVNSALKEAFTAYMLTFLISIVFIDFILRKRKIWIEGGLIASAFILIPSIFIWSAIFANYSNFYESPAGIILPILIIPAFLLGAAIGWMRGKIGGGSEVSVVSAIDVKWHVMKCAMLLIAIASAWYFLLSLDVLIPMAIKRFKPYMSDYPYRHGIELEYPASDEWYADADLGYAFHYPKEWGAPKIDFIETRSREASGGFPSGENGMRVADFSVRVPDREDGTTRISFDELTNNLKGTEFDEYFYKKDILVDGMRSVQVEYLHKQVLVGQDPEPTTTVYIPMPDGRVFQFSGYRIKERGIEGVFDEMVGSLKRF